MLQRLTSLASLAILFGFWTATDPVASMANAEETVQAAPAIITAPSVDAAPAPDKPAEASPRWTGANGGVFFGFSPLFKPKVGAADRLNANTFTSLDFGLEFNNRSIVGIRYAKSTIPSLEVYNPSTFLTSHTAEAPATILEVFTGGLVPLSEPYSNLGLFQFFVPVQLGMAVFSVNGTAETYKGLSFDVATGVGVRVYTHSPLRTDISALYHYGIPVTTIQNSGATATVRSPKGEDMKASLTGFELRIGLTILFSDPEQETKK